MDRRLPGGYGQTQGRDAAIRNAESQYLREALLPKEGGWVISTAGNSYFGHYDVTGVLPGANTVRLYYVPERGAVVTCHEARISVATAAAASTVQTALYRYENNLFKQIPNTLASFSSAATGLQQVTLTSLQSARAHVLADATLFVGVWCSDAAVALEGFQSGAGASPRVIRSRTLSSTSLRPSFTLAETTVDSTGDTPMVAYLAPAATLVL